MYVGGVRARGLDGVGGNGGAIVHSSRRGAHDIEHLGSAHDEDELEALKAAAVQRIVQWQGVLLRAQPSALGDPSGLVVGVLAR